MRIKESIQNRLKRAWGTGSSTPSPFLVGRLVPILGKGALVVDVLFLGTLALNVGRVLVLNLFEMNSVFLDSPVFCRVQSEIKVYPKGQSPNDATVVLVENIKIVAYEPTSSFLFLEIQDNQMIYANSLKDSCLDQLYKEKEGEK